jgi:cell wall-associated NlpC family hydrolase
MIATGHEPWRSEEMQLANAVQGALVAHSAAPKRAAAFRRFAILVMTLVLVLTFAAIEASPIAGSSGHAAKGSQATRILRIARSHLGARFRMGAEGQRIGRRSYFDCSGFVYRVYQQAGMVRKIGGSRMRVTSYLRWFQRRGLASRHNPKPGDLIVWGKHGKIHHMGIYMSRNRAISALVNPWGVRIHGITGLATGANNRSSLRVMAYLHVRIKH